MQDTCHLYNCSEPFDAYGLGYLYGVVQSQADSLTITQTMCYVWGMIIYEAHTYFQYLHIAVQH